MTLLFFTLRVIYVNKSFRNEAALTGAAFLAICPWHVILSRWSLDCNIMPFNLMLAVFLFVLAVRKSRILFYCLSAAAFALCMYSYGAATIVVPIFLLLSCSYCLVKRVLSPRQLLYSFITFGIVFLPLFYFYGVNYLGFPEIINDKFSVNTFTSARTGEAFISFDDSVREKLLSNLKSLALALSIGDESYTIAHYFPGYASMFEFTFPITFLGLIVSLLELLGVKKNKTGEDVILNVGNALFLALTISCVILTLVILPDINRMGMIFIPAIFYFTRGAAFVLENAGKLYLVLAGIVLVGALSFAKDYFTEFNRYAISIFMPGYGEAISRAYDIAGDERNIYSTYEGLSSPFMLTLYYTEYDPHKFYTTVKYRDPDAEFRIAESFGNFVFSLPGDEKTKALSGDVFVIASGEKDLFGDFEGLTTEDFGGYLVVYR